MKKIVFKEHIDGLEEKWFNCVNKTVIEMYNKNLHFFDEGSFNDHLAGGISTICIYVHESQLIPFARNVKDVSITFSGGNDTNILYDILVKYLKEENIDNSFEITEN